LDEKPKNRHLEQILFIDQLGAGLAKPYSVLGAASLFGA
jgi:hypothetical protein